MRPVVRVLVTSALALAGFKATVFLWPVDIKAGAALESAKQDLASFDFARAADNAGAAIKGQISSQVGLRAAVGVTAGVVVAALILGA